MFYSAPVPNAIKKNYYKNEKLNFEFVDYNIYVKLKLSFLIR
jgi:hypothetical protein